MKSNIELEKQKSINSELYSEMADTQNQLSQRTHERDQLARKSTNNVTNRLADLYGANYAAGRSGQVAGIQPTIAQGDLPYEQALRIAQMFGGMGSSRSESKPSMLGTII
jgi:hypothetical protein